MKTRNNDYSTLTTPNSLTTFYCSFAPEVSHIFSSKAAGSTSTGKFSAALSPPRGLAGAGSLAPPRASARRRPLRRDTECAPPQATFPPSRDRGSLRVHVQGSPGVEEGVHGGPLDGSASFGPSGWGKAFTVEGRRIDHSGLHLPSLCRAETRGSAGNAWARGARWEVRGGPLGSWAGFLVGAAGSRGSRGRIEAAGRGGGRKGGREGVVAEPRCKSQVRVPGARTRPQGEGPAVLPRASEVRWPKLHWAPQAC